MFGKEIKIECADSLICIKKEAVRYQGFCVEPGVVKLLVGLPVHYIYFNGLQHIPYQAANILAQWQTGVAIHMEDLLSLEEKTADVLTDFSGNLSIPRRFQLLLAKCKAQKSSVQVSRHLAESGDLQIENDVSTVKKCVDIGYALAGVEK